MAKQILISQNDYGIVFNVTLLNEDKTPIIIGNDKVTFYVVKPDNAKEVITDVTIIDNFKGIVEFELKTQHTKQVGNHSIYVELSNPTFEVTTVFAENYYVMEEHGGA